MTTLKLQAQASHFKVDSPLQEDPYALPSCLLRLVSYGEKHRKVSATDNNFHETRINKMRKSATK